MIFNNVLTPAATTNGLRCEQTVDRGTGPKTVVMLHGLFGSPNHWTDIIEPLTDDFRLIAPQLPIDRSGNRRSDGARSISDLTDAIAEVIDAKQIQSPFVLCGNPLGGRISINYKLRYHERSCRLLPARPAGLCELSLNIGV